VRQLKDHVRPVLARRIPTICMLLSAFFQECVSTWRALVHMQDECLDTTLSPCRKIVNFGDWSLLQFFFFCFVRDYRLTKCNGNKISFSRHSRHQPILLSPFDVSPVYLN
jgi:hypothetical protein